MSKLKSVAKAIKAGGRRRYSAGNGVSLIVSGGSATWNYQFRDPVTGKTRTVGLGRAKGENALNLTEARDARHAKRLELRSGSFNLSERGRADSGKDGGRTFGATVVQYLNDKAPGWRGGLNGDEAVAYRRTLLGNNFAKLALPRIDPKAEPSDKKVAPEVVAFLLDHASALTDFAKLPLALVDTAAIKAALAPWAGKPTSEKVRTRIKAILDWATALEYRTGDNPARRVGHMEHVLPEVAKAKHHPAMPWSDVPAFFGELQSIEKVPARALQFLILTAARTGEVAGMRWHEIVGDNGTSAWIVPAGRMKEGNEHRVPLSPAALAVLGPRCADEDYVWGAPLAHGIMNPLVRPLGFTIHGFRSTFTDWAAEHSYSSELREMALAHAVGDAVESAYRRTDLVGKRREMMQAWSDYVTPL